MATKNEENNLFSKVSNIIISVISYAIVIFCVIISIFSLTARANGGIAEFGGYSIMTVQSESMTGTIDKGDLIFVKRISFDDNYNPNVELVPGESICSFYFDINSDGTLEVVTHKLIAKDNELYYSFQGTYKEDPNVSLAIQHVRYNEIIGVYTSHLSGVGKFVGFLQSSIGFFVCFVLPIFIYACYQGYKMIMTILEVKNENASQGNKLTEQEMKIERERIRQEILKEMLEKEKGKAEALPDQSEKDGDK